MSAELDLGEPLSTVITAPSAECQEWIHRGVVQFFGFNPEEAIRCFRKALSFSPNSAMAHYFISLACSPNYNDPNGLDFPLAGKEAKLAVDLIANHKPSLTEWEVAIIKAKTQHFVEGESVQVRRKSYCNAMRSVYKNYRDNDILVTALFAESLMMTAPWELWTRPPNQKAAIPETEELVSVLEEALEKEPSHPGLCHFYIHTMELSATPEKALSAANALRSRVPDHGHFVHMPTHIDAWVGNYKEAVETNLKAIAADEKYKQLTGQDNEMYKMYRMHNYHFAIWSAMFEGQFSIAMQYAEALSAQLPPEAVAFKIGDVPVGEMFFEGFASVPLHVLVRFGKWKEILARPLKDPEIYPATTAVSYYARGIASAILGRLDEADKECENFRNALKNKRLLNCHLIHNVMYGPSDKPSILGVAEHVLIGEVEYFKGNKKEAFEHLRLAVQRDTTLNYDEPWGWMVPARHSLGALLLEEGEFEEAEKVYREDLEKNKKNLWSLLGLQQVLTKQNRLGEAEAIQADFLKASARADIEIKASCFCAKVCCQ